MAVLVPVVLNAGAGKRWLAGDRGVDRAADGVDIGGGRRVLEDPLLGGGVLRAEACLRVSCAVEASA